MINFDFDKYCYGCTACSNICPCDAITMLENREGFQMPSINFDKCVNCHACEKVCPHIQGENKSGSIKGVWLYSSKNDEAKLRSASGSAFFELAKNAIESKCFVFGCVWDENLSAKHIVGNALNDVIHMQGSKYMQSDMGNCLSELLSLLRSGNKVLFSGTPCQATAAHLTAMNLEKGKYRGNLITAAVLCHGVATPKSWMSYKKWLEKKEGSRLIDVNFRNKEKEGYKKSYCRYDFADGHSTYLPTFLPSSPFIEATLVYNLAIRHSCNHCECKGPNEGCDIILGDWYAHYTGDGKLGTSCIVAFSERGRDYVVKSLSGLKEFSYEEVLKDNGFIEKSVQESPRRDEFFNRINQTDCWDHIEELYPPKYKYKKLLVRLGLFDRLKRIIG